MILVCDASCIINLENGEMLTRLLPECSCLVCGEVGRTEIWEDPSMVPNGIRIDGRVTLGAVEALVEKAGLGAGESEAILLCAQLGAEARVAIDDRKGRQLAREMLQRNDSVTGSLGILRMCVQREMMVAEEAVRICERMRKRGGFLPEMPAMYFETPIGS